MWHNCIIHSCWQTYTLRLRLFIKNESNGVFFPCWFHDTEYAITMLLIQLLQNLLDLKWYRLIRCGRKSIVWNIITTVRILSIEKIIFNFGLWILSMARVKRVLTIVRHSQTTTKRSEFRMDMTLKFGNFVVVGSIQLLDLHYDVPIELKILVSILIEMIKWFIAWCIPKKKHHFVFRTWIKWTIASIAYTIYTHYTSISYNTYYYYY